MLISMESILQILVFEIFFIYLFINTAPTKGYSDMVFVPHPSGLHVYNPHNSRGLASLAFDETVEDNMAMFPKNKSKQPIEQEICMPDLHIRPWRTTNDYCKPINFMTVRVSEQRR